MMNQFDFELLKSFLKKNPRMCLFINIGVFSSGNINQDMFSIEARLFKNTDNTEAYII